MQLDLLFQIAGVGILTTVVASVLNSSGRSELANLATVAGLAIVLLMTVSPFVTMAITLPLRAFISWILLSTFS